MASNASNAFLRRDVLPAMGYFVVAYIVVNILATAFGFAVSLALGLSTNAQVGSRVSDPGFQLTEPYILGINVLCWAAFAALYYRKHQVSPAEAPSLALLWLISAMAFDLVLFVLIETPISLTPHEFYIEYQPWIGLTYLSILAGHLTPAMLLVPRGLKEPGASLVVGQLGYHLRNSICANRRGDSGAWGSEQSRKSAKDSTCSR